MSACRRKDRAAALRIPGRTVHRARAARERSGLPGPWSASRRTAGSRGVPADGVAAAEHRSGLRPTAAPPSCRAAPREGGRRAADRPRQPRLGRPRRVRIAAMRRAGACASRRARRRPCSRASAAGQGCARRVATSARAGRRRRARGSRRRRARGKRRFAVGDRVHAQRGAVRPRAATPRRRVTRVNRCRDELAACATTSSAAADGVGARRSATKSAIVKSVSWPTAETTGTRTAAMARATASSLNAHRSSIEPPPRPTITTSTSGTRADARDAPRAISARRAVALHARVAHQDDAPSGTPREEHLQRCRAGRRRRAT